MRLKTPVPRGFSRERLHGAEEQDVADAVGIGEHHYEAVEADFLRKRRKIRLFEPCDVALYSPTAF